MDHTSALVMRVRPPAPVLLTPSAEVPIASLATSPPDNTPVSGGHSPASPAGDGSPTAGRAAPFSGSSSQGNRGGHIAASASSPPVVPATVQKSRSSTASGDAERVQPTGAASVNLSATVAALFLVLLVVLFRLCRSRLFSRSRSLSFCESYYRVHFLTVLLRWRHLGKARRRARAQATSGLAMCLPPARRRA
jgi:hypothetical protein